MTAVDGCTCLDCRHELGDDFGFEPNDQVNMPLLRKVIELAEAEHERDQRDDSYTSRWLQDTWAGVDLNAARALRDQVVSVDTDLFGEMHTVPVSCMTTGCIAGHTVVQAGGELLMDPDDLPYFKGIVAVSYSLVDGKVNSIANHARELLGLTVSQSNALFEGGNTIKDVREVAQAIAKSAGDRL